MLRFMSRIGQDHFFSNHNILYSLLFQPLALIFSAPLSLYPYRGETCSVENMKNAVPVALHTTKLKSKAV